MTTLSSYQLRKKLAEAANLFGVASLKLIAIFKILNFITVPKDKLINF